MIYYAHSMEIYNSSRERSEVRFLKRVFKDVYNPKKLKPGPNGTMGPYLAKVRESQICQERERL